MRKKKIILSLLCLAHLFAKAQQTAADSCFHPDSLRAIVSVLASDSLKGRLSGSGNDLDAAAFIAGLFREAGLKPLEVNKGYYMPFGESMYNVVGVWPGRSKAGQLIIFSAHYDHLGTKRSSPDLITPENGKPEKGDTIYNGANDNASGTAALIALARYYSRQPAQERTLLFVAFSGEERGLLGSTYMADHMTADSVIAVINLEMLGRSPVKKARPFITGDQHSDLRHLLNNQLRKTDPARYGKFYFHADNDKEENLFARSDNFPFARKGVPAHTIMLGTSKDRYYHSLNDEINTLRFDMMSQVTRAVALAVKGLLTGEESPARISDY